MTLQLIARDGYSEVINLTECGGEPTLDRSSGSNWLEKAGGNPCYIDEIAKDLVYEGHHTIGEGEQIAVGAVRNWCHGHGNVKPQTRTKACAAAGEWEAKKAQAHAMHTGVAASENPGIAIELADGTLLGGTPGKLAYKAIVGANGEITLQDGSGNPAPIVPDSVAWDGLGFPMMPQIVREEHIHHVTQNHHKYTGMHQQTNLEEVCFEKVELTTFTDKPWNGAASRFKDTAAYCASCLIDENGSGEKTQSKCHLPVREPDGTVNKNALRNAAARLNQVQASAQSKSSARSRLKSLMKEAGIQTNLSEDREEKVGLLKRIANGLFPNWTVVEEENGVLNFVEREEGEPELSEDAIAYQLPIDLESPKEIGKRLWRKHIVPIGKHINYQGDVLDFSRDTLQKMVQNFKARAFDRVYFTARHSTEAEDSRGVVRDMFLSDDGIYADIEVSEDGDKLLKNNLGEIGTSISYRPNYTREADKKHFGPTIQHIAATPVPHVPGLKLGELVQMSEGEAETKFVDLTEAQYSASEQRKDGDSVSDVQTPEKKKEEVELTMKEMQEAIELANQRAQAAEERAERAENNSQATARNLEIERVDAKLATDYRTVSPAFKREIRAFLLSDASREKAERIELSADGTPTKEEVTLAEQLWRILDMVAASSDPNKPLIVALGEEGRPEMEPEHKDKATAFANRVQAYMQEHKVSRKQAREAIELDMLSKGEEVIF